MPSIYLQMMAAFEKGDLKTARRHQLAAVQIIEVMVRHGGLSAAKAMMKLIGLDCGPVRPPLRNLSVEEVENLRRDLARAGFLE